MYKAVLFDFDGTIFCEFDNFHKYFNKAVIHHGFEPVNKDTLRYYFGIPFIKIVEK